MIPEFKKKTGVDEIRLTEDKKKGKEDFLTCGAFGKTECVVAVLDLMKNEAGCRNSIVGQFCSIGMTEMLMLQYFSEGVLPSLPSAYPPSLPEGRAGGKD